MADDQNSQNQPEESSTPQTEPTDIEATTGNVGPSRWERFKTWYLARKKWTIPASVLAAVVILGGVPWTRYHIAGLAVKKQVIVRVEDSKSGTAVSQAAVKLAGKQAQTNGQGAVQFDHVSVGPYTIQVSKKYYKNSAARITVGFTGSKTFNIEAEATGRQVKIIVKNAVSQKPLAGVTIKIADTSYKTDNNGQAIAVVPAGTATQKATLSLAGYNDSAVSVKVSDKEVAENKFSLTPAGKIYFLSKRTGKLDLMKANLDGSDAKVVAAGTGYEHDYDTALLASADWKYVALVARRSATNPTPQLYVLSTSDDKLLNADAGNANFELRGWAGNSLVYVVTRNDIPYTQANKYKVKSYDAATGKTTLLDQSSYNSAANAYEFYSFVYVWDNYIVYGKNWTLVNYGSPPNLTHTFHIINADGKNHRVLGSYDTGTYTVQYVQHGASSVYIWQQALDSESGTDKFFDYVLGEAAPKQVNIDDSQFYQAYPTYWLSPSGKQTLWSENRDGKNTILVGDSTGDNSTAIASLSDYSAYNWFSDQYVLLTKNDSQLYVMSVKGGPALKVTDYQPTNYPY